jgi:hypothetical protein
MSKAGERPRSESPKPEQEADHPADPKAPETQALEALGGLLGKSADLVRDYLDLLSIEGRLAGRSLVLMLALGIAVALFLVSGWLLLSLAASAWLIEHEWLTIWQAILASALAQALMGLLAWLVIRRLSNNLGFDGFRAALQKPADPEQGKDH